MTDTSGSPKGVEDDLWSKPDETINEKIKDLCPIVITTIDCRAKDDKVSISIMCHSMGNYVLKKMAPETEKAFKFDNIFMVASDVRATTFDVKKGYCKVEDGDGHKDYDHDGADIVRLAKHIRPRLHEHAGRRL